MQTYAYCLCGLVEPNMYALYQIVYSTNKIVKTNNYRLSELAQRTRLVYPYRCGYN